MSYHFPSQLTLQLSGLVTNRTKMIEVDLTIADIFRASQGRAVRQHNFIDIVVSNPAGSGICRFIVGYLE
jgi:hypothetical protein